MEVQTCYVERRFTTYVPVGNGMQNEFVIPGVLFLYITGWIGWVGRKYVRYASTTKIHLKMKLLSMYL
jgi:hypothetical protein